MPLSIPDRQPLPEPPASPAASLSSKTLWAGRALSATAVLFLAFDAAIKVIGHPMAVAGTTELGFPESTVPLLGWLGLACLALYIVPRTSVAGAVLWTGYLGGAVATHVRLENPLFTHTLFPLYVAALLWGGLWLREPRLQILLPVRTLR